MSLRRHSWAEWAEERYAHCVILRREVEAQWALAVHGRDVGGCRFPHPYDHG